MLTCNSIGNEKDLAMIVLFGDIVFESVKLMIEVYK